jgi:peptidoglycan-associated lipoprotein
MKITTLICTLILFAVISAACGKGAQPPVARPTPPTPPPADKTVRLPDPPAPMKEPMPPEPPLAADSLSSSSIDDINKASPLQPVFFEYDSAEVTDQGRSTLQANATMLKKYSTWIITIEGHCDERGTAEYNLALGERRAVAARTYLISLGVDANRLRTVTYGSEFPFDPGHQESAWSRNRRAHFVITAK